MKEHRLDFLNPVLRQGINSTVRLGSKWNNKCDVGDFVNIYPTGMEKIVEKGIIVGKAILPFSLIPTELIAYEHDPSCTNHYGLAKAMRKAYPGEFNEQELCTVLLFVI